MKPNFDNIMSLNLNEIGDFLAKFTEKCEQVYWISSTDLKQIKYISPSFERIWGRPREELYKNPELWITYLLPEDAKVHHPIHELAEKIKIYGENARYSENYRIVRPNGEIRYIKDYGFPIIDEGGTCCGVTGIAMDVTTEQEQFEELKKSKEAAEAANFIRTEFIANMGHDLATPISDVGSIAQMLASYSDEYPELKDFFDLLKTRAEACEKVRKSIIDATSLSNLDTKVEKFSIIKELLIFEQNFRPIIGVKNLQLIIHPFKPKREDIIETDREKFLKILFELISNAINFTEEGQVNVNVFKKNDIFSIEVSDTGIGIPADKFDYIFEQYTKLSRSNKYGAAFKGVGAGLYLARIRAQILNASIHVESEIGKGSTFTFSIPACLIKNPLFTKR